MLRSGRWLWLCRLFNPRTLALLSQDKKRFCGTWECGSCHNRFVLRSAPRLSTPTRKGTMQCESTSYCRISLRCTRRVGFRVGCSVRGPLSTGRLWSRGRRRRRVVVGVWGRGRTPSPGFVSIVFAVSIGESIRDEIEGAENRLRELNGVCYGKEMGVVSRSLERLVLELWHGFQTEGGITRGIRYTRNEDKE